MIDESRRENVSQLRKKKNLQQMLFPKSYKMFNEHDSNDKI